MYYKRGTEALQAIKAGKEKPAKIVAFDIETINWIEPYALGIYDGNNYNMFEGKECIRDFLDFYLSHKFRNTIIYAHNGGKFDFSFVFRELLENGYAKNFEITPIRVGARIVQIKISSFQLIKGKDGKEKRKLKDNWTFRDSYAILGFSLAKLTKNFDVESLKGEFDHTKINWENWQDLKLEWSPYLENDCKGLYQVLKKFEAFIWQRTDVGLREVMTIAQLAMRMYRKKYLKKSIPVYKAAEEDIRKSHLGGRTEVFRMYGENLRYYDFNSLYPYVMKEYPMPVGLPLKSYAFKTIDFGVAYAKITTPKNIKYPLLPFKEKGKLIFPKGSWTGWYCSPELKKAEEIGYKIEIIYGYKFQQDHIFTEYITDWYNVKEDSKKDSVPYITAKLSMNSLYGKFGQRREKESISMFPENTIGLTPMDFFGDLPVYSKKVISDSKHILPAVASFVTCYARLELYKLIEKIVSKGGKIYYCDTDSLITDIELPTSKKLGDIKDEIPEGIKEAVFLLPKMYGILTTEEQVIKCKGFPNKLFTFDIFKEALFKKDTSKINYSKSVIATPFESMRRNKTFVSMIKFSRRVISKYDKRIVLDNFDTDPREIIA